MKSRMATAAGRPESHGGVGGGLVLGSGMGCQLGRQIGAHPLGNQARRCGGLIRQRLVQVTIMYTACRWALLALCAMRST